jgi:hypothetical protein
MKKIDSDALALHLLQPLKPETRQAIVDAVTTAIAVALQLASDDLVRALPAENESLILDTLTNSTPAIVGTGMDFALFMTSSSGKGEKVRGPDGKPLLLREHAMRDTGDPIAAYALRCGQKFHSKA